MEKPEVKTYAPPANAPAGYTAFVAAAVRGALGLEPPPITTEESLRAIETVFGAYQAADEAKTIKLGQPASLAR